MKVFIASDHRGFELKDSLRRYLMAAGLDVEDMGPNEYEPNDDYPDFVIPVAKEMEKIPYSRAVLICKNGVGVSIVANRFNHIRAALTWSVEHVKTAKEDDHANVIALPAGFISESDAKEIIDAWLETDFSNEERHLRRLKKIDDL